MIPSERDTARVMRERIDVFAGEPRCKAIGNTRVQCERHAGHLGAHYAQVRNGCGPGKPAHCRWNDKKGDPMALYPKAARRRDNQAKPRPDKELKS